MTSQEWAFIGARRGPVPAASLAIFSQISLSLPHALNQLCEEGTAYTVFITLPVCVCVLQTCNQEPLRIKGPPAIKELVGG